MCFNKNAPVKYVCKVYIYTHEEVRIRHYLIRPVDRTLHENIMYMRIKIKCTRVDRQRFSRLYFFPRPHITTENPREENLNAYRRCGNY